MSLMQLLAFLTYKEPRVIERDTGELVVEKVPPEIRFQLGVLFNTWAGLLLSRLPWLRHYQLQMSERLGKRYDSMSSRSEIPKFIKDYGVRLDELNEPLEAFHTLNEFFARRLRPGARPILCPADSSLAVQPADARVVAFASADRAQQLWIKARRFSLQELLAEPLPAVSHAILVARLAPDDYHRFHSPVAGTITSITCLGKELFSVKALAVQSRINVLSENKRVVLRLDTGGQLGVVWVVAVGAAQVGSVRLSVAPQQAVCKGQELGWFQYGGSTVVVVFEAARIRLDVDLLEQSERGVETLVRMGTSLGQAV